MTIPLGQTWLIPFVLIDDTRVEVTGLGDTFSVEISKNGAAFAAGTGTKAEIGNGWYSYELTADETDTTGPLAIRVTGTGAVQQNLLDWVSGAAWEPGTGTYILTTTEAATVLRCADDDANMLMLLPGIDAYIKRGSRDWTTETPIPEEAKNAARIALIQWHENPGMTLSEIETLSLGFKACMMQLEVMALYYYIFEGLSSAGYIMLASAKEGDTVASLVGKVGTSGDQSAKFESVISVDGYIQQTSSDDLSDKWFEVKLVPPGEM